MSEPQKTAATNSEDLPSGAIDLADCGRQVRGFLAAAFVPGLLGGLAIVLYGAYGVIGQPDLASQVTIPRAAGAFVFYAVMGAFFGLVVTVPAILVAGLPAYLVYRRLGWTDWPRHLLGGAVIGWLVGIFAFGGLQALKDPASLDLLRWATGFDSPWRLGSVFLGAASVLMLWSVLYTRRSWLMFFGLLLACPLVTWWLS